MSGDKKRSKFEEKTVDSDGTFDYTNLFYEAETLHKWGIMVEERTIFLESEYAAEDTGDIGINHNTSMRFLKNLALLETLSQEHITIILNTIGGDVSNGFAIYDAILHCSCPTTIKVYGNCMSMGSIILQAADYRILSQNSSIMFHHGDPGFAGGQNSFEAFNFAKFNVDLGQKADDIVLAALNKKRKLQGQSLLPAGKFQDINLRGKYMFAEEAVRLGLADEIIPLKNHLDVHEAMHMTTLKKENK